MRHSPIVLFFLLVFTVNVVMAQGSYTVDSHPLQNGTVDIVGAGNTVSFFELPLWVQLAWVISSFLAIIGAVKFGPFILGKVKAIIQNKNRTAILEYIENNPGCTLADLSKNTGINRGTTKYHFYTLLIERKVVRKKDGKLNYLFTNGGRPFEKERMYGYIMNPVKQEILNLILNRPGISNKEIAERLQLKRNTVHWHLQQFLDEKMVVSRWDGKSIKYFLLPEVEAILREYRRKSV